MEPVIAEQKHKDRHCSYIVKQFENQTENNIAHTHNSSQGRIELNNEKKREGLQ